MQNIKRKSGSGVKLLKGASISIELQTGMKVHGSDLRVTALDTWMMGKVNRERLAVYLGELQRKEDTNDRYVAALRGETFTRNPYARIQSIPKRNNTEADKEQKLDNDQRKQVS
ncbi:hypothetical protein NC652_026197 [Populus alba x Populus x berolinensis]|nr:hypothetical protein NC652_026197 [Populus alba x Populus x berolinensis]